MTGDRSVRRAPSDQSPSVLANSRILALIVACGLLANAAALSPTGDRISELSARIHDTQHAIILAASALVGAGLWDFTRSRPRSLPFRLTVIALGLVGVLMSSTYEYHGFQHALLVCSGALIGSSVRDGLLARGFRRSALRATYAPETYLPSALRYWIETARRQDAKDRVLLPALARNFIPGRVLELGAGAGQTALLLGEQGREVIATDYHEFFVDHLQSLGLRAARVDATDIAASGLGTFPNIFCQSITPLITSDVDVIARTYCSLHDALEPGGRLVEIHAQAARHELHATMRLHVEQARRAGFEDVRAVRNQLLPSRAYRTPLRPIAALAEAALGRHLGIRFVLVAQRGRGPQSSQSGPGATRLNPLTWLELVQGTDRGYARRARFG